ncbi:MAG: hypothetical protein JXB50_05420, partial [Spirochaetes bacterium]|nr:hypothetical protein [Spirochaetota bacterium]
METKQIIIKSIETGEKEYVAYFTDEFMQASYCVIFKDSILGAVSLNRFIDMIKTFFDIKKLAVFISEEKFEIKSKALLDVLIK